MHKAEKGAGLGGNFPDLWEVAVALPLFQTLTYRLPPALQPEAQVGCLVQVPVGRRQVKGYLLGPAREVPGATLREVLAVSDPLPRFGPELVSLWRWVADYYQYPIGEALSHLIPGSSRPSGPKRERWVTFVPQGTDASPPRRLGPRGREILAYLREAGEPVAVRELRRVFPTCGPVLKRLSEQGLVSFKERLTFADPLKDQPPILMEPQLTLVPEQQDAVQALTHGIRRAEFAPYLLHGVTASGKTEVYLAAAQEALAQGRQVLVLLPEIALTHPVALEFRRRFGDRVALLHSGLTDSQRLDQWRRLAAGRAQVAVGARSAVFAPLPRLGLIVVDEEHDPAYKHEGGLPYQARDVALVRGTQAGAAVVLVSATPAVSTFYRAREGRYHYLHLSRRVTPQALPRVQLVNLKEHRRGPALKIISPRLAAAVTTTLEQGEQALLFLNRRGYSTVMFCLFCGTNLQCEHCSVALTQHHARNRLICHYCGYEIPPPERCPTCQSTALKKHGVGTERVEAEVRRLWPAARVARLDRDTAPTSGRALKVLQDFAAGDLDLLVGTQMITKGHHFPGVTLVGVINADQSLFFPEYHAGERTFQLLAQVAGRAGRGGIPGKVLIQTYQPEHYVFETLQELDYEEFYAREMVSRRELGYPPFTRLALVRLSGVPEETVARQAQKLADALRRLVPRHPDLATRLRVLGPAPAGLAKLKNRWRWQILLKSYGRPPLLTAIQHLRQTWSPPPKSKIDLTVDIDPAHLF
ncbi:MAG: replication restart helicase PriA [Thermodesulfobacteriota bacterium]